MALTSSMAIARLLTTVVLPSAASGEVTRMVLDLALVSLNNTAVRIVRYVSAQIDLESRYAEGENDLEGHVKARHYQGQKFMSKIENYAADLMKDLFGCNWTDVRLVSGTLPIISPSVTSSPFLTMGMNCHFLSLGNAGALAPLLINEPVSLDNVSKDFCRPRMQLGRWLTLL